MSGALSLLTALRGFGFSLKAEGGRLVVNPASKLYPAQREALKAYRAELLALLADEAEAPLLRQMADHAFSRAGEGGPAAELVECFLWPEG